MNKKNNDFSIVDALHLLLNEELLDEQILNETKRLQFISKSRKGAQYKSKKGNRWSAKINCKVANTVKEYNKLNMDKFWKNDLLNLGIRVKGETGDYIVKVEFTNILSRLQEKIKQNRNLLELKLIYKSLTEALNSSDVKVSCSCPDFKYRLSYWLSQHDEIEGEKENREAQITNPNDNLGAGCKHILCILNNADWLHKISSVINNYVAYAKEHMEDLYARYIFPKLYGMEYKKAIQLCIDDFDENGELKTDLKSDEATLNLANALGKERGKIKKGSNKNPIAQERKKELEKQAKENEK